MYQSLGAPIGSHAACSGDMNSGVPRTAPSAVTPTPCSASMSRTRPKSRITTRPPGSTSTLDGLRSRCRKPASWIAWTPSASCRIASRTGPKSMAGGWLVPLPCSPHRCSTKFTPRMSSIEKNRRLPSKISSCSWMTLWCRTSASARNSRLNRTRPSGLMPRTALTASGGAPGSSGSASNTSPTAPRPSRPTIVYGPRCEGIASSVLSPEASGRRSGSVSTRVDPARSSLPRLRFLATKVGPHRDSRVSLSGAS